MNGAAAFLEEVEEPIKTESARRDLKDGSRDEPKACEAGDEGDVEALVAAVERDVDEDVTVAARPCGHRAA